MSLYDPTSSYKLPRDCVEDSPNLPKSEYIYFQRCSKVCLWTHNCIFTRVEFSGSQESNLSQISYFKGRVKHPRWDIILMWSVPERSVLQKHYSCYNLQWREPAAEEQMRRGFRAREISFFLLILTMSLWVRGAYKEGLSRHFAAGSAPRF